MSHNVCLHLISFFAHYRQCDWIWWYSSVFSSTPLRCIACCPNSKVPETVDHVLYTALSYLLSLNKSLIVQSNLLLYYLSLECILMKKMQFWHFFGFTSQQEVMLLGNSSPKSDGDRVEAKAWKLKNSFKVAIKFKLKEKESLKRNQKVKWVVLGLLITDYAGPLGSRVIDVYEYM